MGRRVIGISGSLTWSKILMELIFKPCGEFRWSPEGPVSKSTLFASTLVCLGSFRSFKVCSNAKESGVWKATGSYSTYLSLVKLQPWFLSLRYKTCLWAELQPWCLSLQWRTCPWAEHWWWWWWWILQGVKGDWDFRISYLVKNPDGTDI